MIEDLGKGPREIGRSPRMPSSRRSSVVVAAIGVFVVLAAVGEFLAVSRNGRDTPPAAASAP
jgi:hypothetical protein